MENHNFNQKIIIISSEILVMQTVLPLIREKIVLMMKNRSIQVGLKFQPIL